MASKSASITPPTVGSFAASGGQSQKRDRPTTRSPAPTAKSASVVAGDTDTMRCASPEATPRRVPARAPAEEGQRSGRERRHDRSVHRPMSPYLCSFSMSAGRETPSRRAVSLWLRLADSKASAMSVRSKASTRARSGCPGPGSPDAVIGMADGEAPSDERSPERQGDPLVGRKREEARDRVLELPDVARPAVRAQRLDERGLDVDPAHAVALGVLAHERAHERLDVLRALAQRRDADRHHVEPVEEIFAEAPALHVRRRGPGWSRR